ncbi:MAG: hypothetical protein Ct9H300mP12_16690 [Acidimicrobiales bacterium]|nr:MAG: hypothetical protein Ct9H300mP12_16690 [Acidimicrobiales bacterium]
MPPAAGASFTPSLSDAGADSTHPEQYYEQMGHRGFYRDGWSAVTFPPASDAVLRGEMGTPPSDR